MKVKDMPRNQQKAVFAHWKDPDKGYLYRLEGAEKYRKKRDFLIKKQDLAEETEDKIARIMMDKRLTHRQKMAKINEIKKDAEQDLKKLKAASEAPTTTGEIRRIRQWKARPEVVEIGGERTVAPALTAKEAKDRAAFERKLMVTADYKNARKAGRSHGEAITLALEAKTRPEKGKKWWERRLKGETPKASDFTLKPHVTFRYARYKIRDPEEFKRGSFRVHDIGREGHSKRIAGRLKSTSKWETQAILLSKSDYSKGSYLQKKNGKLKIIHPQRGRKAVDAEKPTSYAKYAAKYPRYKVG